VWIGARRGKPWGALFIGALLALPAVAQPSRPADHAVLHGVPPHDPRQPVDPAQAPWSALARLQIPGTTRCTAVLVAPRVALTAAHCLYGWRVGHFMPPGSVHLLQGYRQGHFAAHAVVLRYAMLPGYDPQRAAGSIPRDAAALLLDRALPDAMPLDATPPQDAMPVALAGYAQDRPEIPMGDLDCRAAPRGTEVLAHDCAGTFGTSGAPLLRRGAAGWVVAGLNVAATGGTGTNTGGGQAVAAAALRPLLEALDEGRKW
jgi:protease YdgD